MARAIVSTVMRTMVVLALLACDARADGREILVGGPCQGCEYVFVERPAKLTSSTRIAPSAEPGEPLAIDGIVRDARGAPVAGIIVYAYHTDAKGIYPPGKTRHGALRGFAVTDKSGAYHFDTIRPGPYPGRVDPQHIHVHVVEPGKCHYTIDDIVFSDDPLLTDARLKSFEGRGGSGVATPRRDGKVWRVRRDITLGAKIHDYDRCR